MKKLLVLMLVLCTCFLNILYASADDVNSAAAAMQDNIKNAGEVGIFDDLGELSQLYTPNQYAQLTGYADKLVSMLKNQREIINTMGNIYYLGYANNALNEAALIDILAWKADHNAFTSPIFSSSYFGDYSKHRLSVLDKVLTGKVQYDYKAFFADTKAVFDKFIQGSIKDESMNKDMILLLQDKLLDRLMLETVTDKEHYFDYLLSLRKDTGRDIRYGMVYELFESKVRIQVLEKMLENNRVYIRQFIDKLNISLETQADENSTTNNTEAVQYTSGIMNNKLSEKGMEAQLILRELDKYTRYAELKEEGINNRYTASFEAAKTAWVNNLKMLFKGFASKAADDSHTEQGYQMSGFVMYIKEFIDYSRNVDEADAEGRKTILKFRQTVFQFMTVQEGSYWLLDSLYKINFDTLK